MEKESILNTILNEYDLQMVDPNLYSPLNLAFIGDSVYGLVVKSVIVLMGNCPASALNQKANYYIKAVTQAKIIDALLESSELSEEEENIYRRGRNAKSPTTAKNASVGEYRRATGLEALVGYLYLQGKSERLIHIMKIGMELVSD